MNERNVPDLEVEVPGAAWQRMAGLLPWRAVDMGTAGVQLLLAEGHWGKVDIGDACCVAL